MAMTNMSEFPVKTFAADSTLRMACREGDLMIWFRGRDWLNGSPKIPPRDTWSIKNGDFVTLTNRLVDIPKWIEMSAGPDSDGSNIWRVCIGDRIAWVGPARPGQPATDDEVLSIVAFDACALVIGEGNWKSVDDAMSFGISAQQSPSEAERRRGRAAFQMVRKMGIPLEVSTEWRVW